jgi:hypothetical protein
MPEELFTTTGSGGPPPLLSCIFTPICPLPLYGKGGEFVSNKLEDQELLMLSLHLLQVSLVYVNTLMMQQVLAQPEWQGRLTAVDLRALSPLKWQHVNPYGTFTLNIYERLSLEQVSWSPGATLPKFQASLG